MPIEEVKETKMGRPKIHIDKDTFEVLMCIPLCTQEHIAAVFKCHPDTIANFIRDEYETTFSALKEQKRGVIPMKLAAKQYEVAMKGNVSMLIWLGKQYLGQSDKQEVKADLKNEPVIIEFTQSISQSDKDKKE